MLLMDTRALLDAFRGGFHLEEVSNGWSCSSVLGLGMSSSTEILLHSKLWTGLVRV